MNRHHFTHLMHINTYVKHTHRKAKKHTSTQRGSPAETLPAAGSWAPGCSASSGPSPPAHSPERHGFHWSGCLLGAGWWPEPHSRGVTKWRKRGWDKTDKKQTIAEKCDTALLVCTGWRTQTSPTLWHAPHLVLPQFKTFNYCSVKIVPQCSNGTSPTHVMDITLPWELCKRKGGMGEGCIYSLHWK